MFGLEERHIHFIINILNKNINNIAKYYVFGSRSKGDYKEYSDIDIAIDSGERIQDSVMSAIMADFENSTLPYKVDVVDLNSVSEDFKNLIKDDLKKLKKFDK